MAKYRVYMQAYASLVVTVDVDDEDLDLSEAEELAIERAYEEAPSGVCAQCSGWGQSWGLDLGEFEIETDKDGKETLPKRVG